MHMKKIHKIYNVDHTLTLGRKCENCKKQIKEDDFFHRCRQRKCSFRYLNGFTCEESKPCTRKTHEHFLRFEDKLPESSLAEKRRLEEIVESTQSKYTYILIGENINQIISIVQTLGNNILIKTCKCHMQIPENYESSSSYTPFQETYSCKCAYVIKKNCEIMTKKVVSQSYNDCNLKVFVLVDIKHEKLNVKYEHLLTFRESNFKNSQIYFLVNDIFAKNYFKKSPKKSIVNFYN